MGVRRPYEKRTYDAHARTYTPASSPQYNRFVYVREPLRATHPDVDGGDGTPPPRGAPDAATRI